MSESLWQIAERIRRQLRGAEKETLTVADFEALSEELGLTPKQAAEGTEVPEERRSSQSRARPEGVPDDIN